MSGIDDMDCLALTNTVFAASAREVPCGKNKKNKKTKNKTKLLQVFCFSLLCFAHTSTLCNVVLKAQHHFESQTPPQTPSQTQQRQGGTYMYLCQAPGGKGNPGIALVWD